MVEHLTCNETVEGSIPFASIGVEMHWKKYNGKLENGYLILRFLKDNFIMGKCEYGDSEFSFTVLNVFAFNKYYKTLKDFQKYMDHNQFNMLISIFGKPTHWRKVDLELPKYWKDV